MERCKKMADAAMIYALSIKDETKRQSYIEYVKRWQRRNNRETILKDASSVYPVRLADFDRDKWIYNCQNGTLNLKTREFHKHNPDDMLSKVSNVFYDPAATCPLWIAHIDTISEHDEGLALFIQKGFGYSLPGDTSYECIFLLFGPKSRNGKSTTTETILFLHGDYGTSARPDTIAMKPGPNGSGPNEDIARLNGVRFVNIAEPDKRLLLSASTVKTLTGGDTINARFLHENSFNFRPAFKIYINTNHLPAITDVTLFESDRIKVIPFDHYFEAGERSHDIKSELLKRENISGIFNWCLDGLALLEQEGLETPERVREATEQYRQDSDKLGRFLSDEMEKGVRYDERTTTAYQRYQIWCDENGFGCESSKTFTKDLADRGLIKQKRPYGGGNPTTLIDGYRLRYDRPEDDDRDDEIL